MWLSASAEALHELRKRVVIHRYQIELAAPLWPRFINMWSGEAQRLRERLGRHRDLLMLEQALAGARPSARWRAELAALISERRAAEIAAAARFASRLFVEKPNMLRRRLASMWAAAP